MWKLADASGPVVKRILVARLRRDLEPRLKKDGITWEDVVPSLEAITVEVLKECAESGSIEPIMEELAEASGPLAKASPSYLSAEASSHLPYATADLVVVAASDGTRYRTSTPHLEDPDIAFVNVFNEFVNFLGLEVQDDQDQTDMDEKEEEEQGRGGRGCIGS